MLRMARNDSDLILQGYNGQGRYYSKDHTPLWQSLGIRVVVFKSDAIHTVSSRDSLKMSNAESQMKLYCIVSV